MSFKLEPNNNDSAGSFSAAQTKQLNRLNEVSGNGIVPLTDNREVTTTRGGRDYFKKIRKTESGKYIKNTSPASLKASIDESTSDKYAKLNKTINEDRWKVKGMDRDRKQNYNPFND